MDYLSQASAKNKIALGGVKANIGHCFAAADIASVIKTSLCLYHRFIPGIPNWKTPKQIDALKNSPFYFPTKAQPWIKDQIRGNRQAAINGAGQEQVLLSESIHRKVNEMPFSNAHSSKLFAIKADTAKTLDLQLTALEIAIETKTPYQLSQVSFTKPLKPKQENIPLV